MSRGATWTRWTTSTTASTVDYLEEALAAAGAGELLVATPRRYEVDFVASAERDEVLVGRAWPHEDGWAYRLSRDDGMEIFRARVATLRGLSPR